ncbi:hypothetical protein SGFS_042770 [Streptomyces graminofaciens]|uniref:Transposase n=2 Tax=Streptomyces graminofaciens TaxID=68212 RepID=A0ABN5VKQ1_9ACTN|nr:hypothetical protein SGFS_042770 [Streptomyces graminofaciens]
MLLTSSGVNPVLLIAQMVQADEDTIRDAIHRFDEPAWPSCSLGVWGTLRAC